MKKLLFAFASLALISNAVAQDGADMKWNAEMRFRFNGVENAGFAEKSWDNETQQRTKLGVTMTKGEDLTATVTLLAASTWGNGGVENTSGDLTADGADSNVYVYEAFAFWKAMDNFALKIGRGALDLADGTVVSKNDWEQTPTTFEGVYGVYFTEFANIGVFGVKGMNDSDLDSNDDLTTDDADVNFYGLSVDVKNLPEWLKMLNIHALQSKATGITVPAEPPTLPVPAPGSTDEKLRIGLTLKGDTSGVDYRATYATYTGETHLGGVVDTTVDSKASMIDAEVGYTMADMMNMRVHALYHTDSGQDGSSDNTEYDPFFYEKHANAGLMDVVNWGNSTYIKVGVAAEPAEMTKVGLDYYMFTLTEDGGGDDDVGNEIDLWATRALSNGAELNARIGMFQAGDAQGAGAEDITDFSVGATFRF